MKLKPKSYPDVTVYAEKVGGIEETSIEFQPGVTILVGQNASNRTSFLQGVAAALGSENASIKADADEARVELTLGNETYTRTLQRRDNSIVIDGNAYLDDPTLADLFAFLLESNEARRAVANSQNLHDLIMRPVDTEAIEADIGRLVDKRGQLEDELEEINDLKGDLPGLEEERTRLQTQIEEKRAELESKKEKLGASDVSVKETRAEKSELEEKLAGLRSKRADLKDIRYDLETERKSLESLKRERQELDTEQTELPETPAGDIDELDSEIDRLRGQKQHLEAEVNELQSVIGFNEEMLEDGEAGAFADLTEAETENLTNQLIEDDDVTCWTCGSTVEEEQIETTIDRLRELSQSKVNETKKLERKIGDLRDEKRELEQDQRERERVQRRRSELETEIEQTENAIERLQTRRDDLAAEIEDLETEVEALESEDNSEILNLHKEANQLEYDLGRLEGDFDDVESKIARYEERIARSDGIREQIEEVNVEIENLRTKIERIEQGSIDQFNEQMDTVLDLLDYTNIDRIWLERSEREVREGRRKVNKVVFELHVVRQSASGIMYEDTIDHLSESEREVTGLVFALAGYLAHEVYEEVPFMLIDSLEAIDAERIAALISHLRDYTGYLLVALLPEDAAALSEEYTRISEI